MNSIKKFSLENFQSHMKTTIEPAPPGQLTVITGASDSGKTVILRALRWAFNNQPQGNDFIRVGASLVRASVDYESGHTVVRERTKATNRYKIVAAGAEPQVFEGFGGNVPLEVQEVTGVRPVKIGDLELNLNLAEQLQGPFLGSAISGGARAKVLGKLAGTEEIDHAAKTLGTDLYRRNQDEKRLTAEVAGLEENIKGFDYLPAMKGKIEHLERLAERIKANQERRGKLVEMKERLQGIAGNIYYARLKIAKWRGLEQAEKLSFAVREKNQRTLTVQSLKLHLQEIERSTKTCKEVIAKYAGLAEAEGMLSNAQATAEKVRQLRNLRTSYSAGQEMIQHSQQVLAKLDGLSAAWLLLMAIDAKKLKQYSLVNFKAVWDARSKAVDETKGLLKRYAGVDEAGEKLASVAEVLDRRESLNSLSVRHEHNRQFIIGAKERIVVLENRVAELEGAYHDLLESAGICPLCGQEIKSKIKEAV